ncbi:MAG: TolC family protein, partial [Bryobacteraceae bacterium]
MMRRALLFLMPLLTFAQPPKVLTLVEAEALAIRNHPRISAAGLSAQAADQVTAQVKAALSPTVIANLTGVGAALNTDVSAGNVTTSALSGRLAGGVVASQLLYDFGRTRNLTKSADLRAGAQREVTHLTRNQTLLEVRAAYYRTLQAQSVLRVAQETVDARKLTLKQVSRLAESKLKSSLDVTFAEVNVSEAELVLFRAENDISAALASLSASLGYDGRQTFTLAEQPMPSPLEPGDAEAVKAALGRRPELLGLRLQRDANLEFARGEKALQYPTISALGVAGGIPVHDSRLLHPYYAAAGVNVSIPVLNGGIFSARRAEADLRAQAAAQDVRDLEIRIERDVRVAWLNAENAFRRLD